MLTAQLFLQRHQTRVVVARERRAGGVSLEEDEAFQLTYFVSAAVLGFRDPRPVTPAEDSDVCGASIDLAQGSFPRCFVATREVLHANKGCFPHPMNRRLDRFAFALQ